MGDSAKWFDALKAKGHMPVVDEDGKLNFFVCDSGYHNGPGCHACGWSCCWHCCAVSDIPECIAIAHGRRLAERSRKPALENGHATLADAHSKPDPLPEPDKEG